MQRPPLKTHQGTTRIWHRSSVTHLHALDRSVVVSGICCELPWTSQRSVRGPPAASATGWTLFSRKCWFIKTQTFCGNRGPLTKSLSLWEGEVWKAKQGDRHVSWKRHQHCDSGARRRRRRSRFVSAARARQMRGGNSFLHILIEVAWPSTLGKGSLSQKTCSFLVQRRENVQIVVTSRKSPLSQLAHRGQGAEMCSLKAQT